MKLSNIKIAFLLGFIFFCLGLFTLPSYGINWDTINHLPRGQAYLHYFLTGEKDYTNVAPWKPYWQNPVSLGIDTDIPQNTVSSRSFYQIDAVNGAYFLTHETGGHPPLSDILSSIFNRIFFGQLRLINDVDSYRIYGIFLASCLVALIFWWVAEAYKSNFTGLIASISLGLYPLFWSEAHFNNEKDIPETVYWSFMFFSIWKGVKERSIKWVLVSGVFFGLALGTKFNILFSPIIILPWLLLILITYFINGQLTIKQFVNNNKLFITSFIAAVFIGVIIFIASWPYLWADPIGNITSVIKFYKTIGTTDNVNLNYTGPFNINTYPFQWILYTTPPVILFFALLGVIFAIFRVIRNKDYTSLLFLLWLFVTVIRVTWPGMTIYGGIRQIMEYVPALSIMSGLGAFASLLFLSRFIKLKIVMIIILLLFVPHIATLISIHPNENVYFNSLIGGLSGAKERDFPAWGNSFGAAYRQGVTWINENAPKGSRVAFARELMPNIPKMWFRPDLSVSNGYRSGYLQQGEYVIGLVYQGTKDYSYFDSYLESFLIPVFEVKVDNTAVLKVWQNDRYHLVSGWEEATNDLASVQKLDSGLRFDLKKPQKLSRLEIEYSESDCTPLKSGYTRISLDGENWEQLVGVYPRYWRIGLLGQQPIDGKFIEPFFGQKERYIDLVLAPMDTCLKNIKSFKAYYFL